MKSSHSAENEYWQAIEKALGHSFDNRGLLAEAMTHRSYANECHGSMADNERLEFLGDAVLDLVISQYLMSRLPASAEGELTRVRADVVSLPSLASLAKSLDIGAGLLLGRGEERSGGRHKASLLADTLEALFGAVFIDGGYDAARRVILPLFVPILEQAAIDEGQDFKSRLQELLQAAQRPLPVYRMAEASGPAHSRLYRVEVVIDGSPLGSGEGRTKKSAEQSAARAALAQLGHQS